ncbi:RsmB/NOP family class I SAM-dependent RNA methyltransferase [Paracoccus onubensis]|uniref:Methyltransferase domain-containing protein n=1 Tax=Paracoccus onubensis TaxID=1675788 RepID=A0A418SM02_9RHOB|nr:transcription antitermination factor NusB [Paracoccus onubensis]RJE81975.1 methyltransferase domain-containing protein [Paracoccus onubensis]
MAKTVRDSARKGALRLLSGVQEGQSLSDQAASLKSMSPADQARAARLAAEVLRHRDRANRVIATYVSRKPAPQIADILRLATVEMLELHAAAHGVVDTAVGMTRGLGRRGQAAAGMVNAVLRKISRHEGWAELPPQRMPDWLRRSVVRSFGKAAASAIETAHQRGAPLDLTLKPDMAVIEGGTLLPTGSVRITGSVQVSALPGYAEGDWWVQDAAAALPVRLLDPVTGERVADICAAPGGKTLQLAAGGAQVTAVDISAARLKRVAENLTRCGLQAELITADALEWQPDTPPDAILLDAPCSATGTIRRHPDLPILRDGSGIAELAALQSRLLDHALELLRPGGRLVYAVCSLLPDEGEAQIPALLERHPGLKIEAPDLPGIDPAWITPEGGLRLRPDHWPERGGVDGFYMARIRKPL